jgi:hypothetical protein
MRFNQSMAVRLYSQAHRLVAGVLVAMSRLNILVILAAVILSSDPPVTPPILLRAFATLVLAPGIAAWLVARRAAATVRVDGDTLVLQRRGLEINVPGAAIAALPSWLVPLPGPGVLLVLQSGRRLPYGVQTDDVRGLMRQIAAAGAVGAVAAAERRAPAVYAAHRRALEWRWYHYAGKFGLFALPPAAILFNAHQYIAYGGTFGQYYLLGLEAYAATFANYWATTAIYLVLYAGAWRALAEATNLAAAWIAPSRAARVRSAAELACRLAYYLGVPVLLALRFMP